MLFLLLALADPDTGPIEAERAFARAAQARGQWTAFREFMTDDAIVFTPQPAKAKDALPTKNPPIAVQWWPAKSYVSCDGQTAVNTGSWVRPDSVGYFTTIWQRQPNGEWKWLLDHGDTVANGRALPERPIVRRARCAGKTKPFLAAAGSKDAADVARSGEAADHSLAWTWIVSPDGSRSLIVWFWNGKRYEPVVKDEVAPPK